MNNFRNDLRSTHFISLRDVSAEESIFSPATRKKNNNAAFITEANTIQNEMEIRQKHSELNRYIDKLDEKVQKIVENNEAQLLIAYKNHFARVKQEMEQFKKVTLQQANSSLNQTEKIEILEKQIIVFREEAIRLFEQIVAKDKIIEEIKLNLSELTAEKKYMDETVKSLFKRNKILQGQLTKKASLQKQSETENIQRIDVNSFTTVGTNNYKRYHQSRLRDRSQIASAKITKAFTQTTRHLNIDQTTAINNTSDNIFLGFSQEIGHFSKRLKIRLSYLEEPVLKDVIDCCEQIYSSLEKENIKKLKLMSKDREEERKPTRFSMRSNSNYTADFRENPREPSLDNNKKQNLSRKSQMSSKKRQNTDFFKRCVDTVKKEIVRRKKMNTTNFYKEGSPISIDEFKKMDFFRILQLVFSNQCIIKDLYNSLMENSQ